MGRTSAGLNKTQNRKTWRSQCVIRIFLAWEYSSFYLQVMRSPPSVRSVHYFSLKARLILLTHTSGRKSAIDSRDLMTFATAPPLSQLFDFPMRKSPYSLVVKTLCLSSTFILPAGTDPLISGDQIKYRRSFIYRRRQKNTLCCPVSV